MPPCKTPTQAAPSIQTRMEVTHRAIPQPLRPMPDTHPFIRLSLSERTAEPAPAAGGLPQRRMDGWKARAPCPGNGRFVDAVRLRIHGNSRSPRHASGTQGGACREGRRPGSSCPSARDVEPAWRVRAAPVPGLPRPGSPVRHAAATTDTKRLCFTQPHPMSSHDLRTTTVS